MGPNATMHHRLLEHSVRRSAKLSCRDAPQRTGRPLRPAASATARSLSTTRIPRRFDGRPIGRLEEPGESDRRVASARDMTVRNLSPASQRSYVHAVAKFGRFFGRSPERLDLEDVRAFQVHLVAGGISWPALNQTVCALRFLYGVTRPCCTDLPLGGSASAG